NNNNSNNNNNNSNNNSSNNNGNGGQNQTPDPGIRLPEKGKTYSVGLAYYRVTEFSETEKTVTYVKPKRKNLKTITIPSSVKIEGVTFQVTAIADKACWKNGKLSKVIVGRNVKVIGKSAFAGDRKLKSMIVKSMSLKKVGKSALKGIHAGCRITVGKKQLKKYTKLFRGKGQKASVKVGLQ
ncbi:MAG: leucine-rich repeat protein, partial [Hominisplanchenecus sp.]